MKFSQWPQNKIFYLFAAPILSVIFVLLFLISLSFQQKFMVKWCLLLFLALQFLTCGLCAMAVGLSPSFLSTAPQGAKPTAVLSALALQTSAWIDWLQVYVLPITLGVIYTSLLTNLSIINMQLYALYKVVQLKRPNYETQVALFHIYPCMALFVIYTMVFYCRPDIVLEESSLTSITMIMCCALFVVLFLLFGASAMAWYDAFQHLSYLRIQLSTLRQGPHTRHDYFRYSSLIYTQRLVLYLSFANIFFSSPLLCGIVNYFCLAVGYAASEAGSLDSMRANSYFCQLICFGFLWLALRGFLDIVLISFCRFLLYRVLGLTHNFSFYEKWYYSFFGMILEEDGVSIGKLSSSQESSFRPSNHNAVFLTPTREAYSSDRLTSPIPARPSSSVSVEGRSPNENTDLIISAVPENDILQYVEEFGNLSDHSRLQYLQTLDISRPVTTLGPFSLHDLSLFK
ncbi:hypothetical protein HDU91_006044 [Kappamyces sp. JEL0680]|nr:hypothetical protein HDU91_006044 [Kappamyces sp. JEL0680]